MEQLFSDINEYYNESEQELKTDNEALLAAGKKIIDISEAMIIKRAFNKIRELSKYKKNTFPFYENSKSLIVIDKHKIAYKSGNNHQADFFEKDGKVGCEVIRKFDANDKNFVPDWKKQGCKPIWSLQQGDMVEMDTPELWKNFEENDRCIAEVKGLESGNTVSLFLSSDARNAREKEKKAPYMLSEIGKKRISKWREKSANVLGKHHARKIELTPFGKIKRKHKVLWHGKKKTG